LLQNKQPIKEQIAVMDLTVMQPGGNRAPQRPTSAVLGLATAAKKTRRHQLSTRNSQVSENLLLPRSTALECKRMI